MMGKTLLFHNGAKLWTILTFNARFLSLGIVVRLLPWHFGFNLDLIALHLEIIYWIKPDDEFDEMDQAAYCQDCGEQLQAARPGKYQCPNCE
jgi:hypothetical protein